MNGFDPAAEFLLTLLWPNLFEPADASEREPLTYRCKGCQHIVARPEREGHYKRHQKEQLRIERERAAALKAERVRNLAKARKAKAAS